MRDIPSGQIAAAVDAFLGDGGRAPSRRRERSWDFCYDYFQDHPSPTEDIELSCLHLGYYLASWGMLRGSSYLFKNTNALHYRDTIEVIEHHNPTMRGWDVPAYLDQKRCAQYETVWADLRTALLPDGGRSLTLISKVMMGVWGCIPSFDSYFVSTYRALSTSRSERAAWGRANADALRMLHTVYDTHRNEIETVRHAHRVWSLSTGKPTDRPLPVAKVLDIYGFHSSWNG